MRAYAVNLWLIIDKVLFSEVPSVSAMFGTNVPRNILIFLNRMFLHCQRLTIAHLPELKPDPHVLKKTRIYL